MNGMTVLETERLILREMTEADRPALQAVIGDPLTMCHFAHAYDDAGVDRWMRWCFACYEKRGFGLWAVTLRTTGEMIGDCGITMQDINGATLPEIGYHLNRNYWRQGYGKEAARACRDWFFTHTAYDAVYSYMTDDNEPSYRTAMANGMTRRDTYTEDGTTYRVYGITREEWQALK